MEITVKIEWDKPEYKEWLCAKNIEWAISACCKNTKFKVTEVKSHEGGMSAEDFLWEQENLSQDERKEIHTPKILRGRVAELMEMYAQEFASLNQVPQVKWIEGNKPDDSGYYYTKTKDIINTQVAYWENYDGTWSIMDYEEVTHYAPINLPEPPKTETK